LRKIRDSPYGTIETWEEDALTQGLITQMDLFEWSETMAPLLPLSLSTMMHHVFFPDVSYPPSRTILQYPTYNQESVYVQHTTSPLLFVFASLSKSLGGTWHRLYTSASDGMSFNRLQNALLGYGGPTLILIQAVTTTSKKKKSIFGAYTSSAWKESKEFYGTSDCFLFQLLPELHVYRPKNASHNTNFMYCNSEARSRGYDQQAHGIGFGGSVHQPRLFLEESLDHCYAGSGDLTFDHGPLFVDASSDDADGLSSTTNKCHFELDQLEVWGVGGEDVVREALGDRQKARAIQDANLQKARKVDKAAFLDDFRSGLIESKAFKHRGEMRGRADACIDDDHKNSYVYEK